MCDSLVSLATVTVDFVFGSCFGSAISETNPKIPIVKKIGFDIQLYY